MGIFSSTIDVHLIAFDLYTLMRRDETNDDQNRTEEDSSKLKHDEDYDLRERNRNVLFRRLISFDFFRFKRDLLQKELDRFIFKAMADISLVDVKDRMFIMDIYRELEFGNPQENFEALENRITTLKKRAYDEEMDDD